MRSDAADLRELAVRDVDRLVDEVDALRWYLTSGTDRERRKVSEAVRKLAYSHPDVARKLEPALQQALAEHQSSDKTRKNIEKAQEFADLSKGNIDDSNLQSLAVSDVDQLPGQLDTIRTQLTASDEDRQRTASEAVRKLAYSYPDWAAELRSQLRTLRRQYPEGHAIHRNVTKAERYIDDRATGTKAPLPAAAEEHVDVNASSGDTAVYDDTTGDTEVYTANSTSDTAVYSGDSDPVDESAPNFETNFCPNCGTDLSALDEQSYCPHCGSELPT